MTSRHWPHSTHCHLKLSGPRLEAVDSPPLHQSVQLVRMDGKSYWWWLQQQQHFMIDSKSNKIVTVRRKETRTSRRRRKKKSLHRSFWCLKYFTRKTAHTVYKKEKKLYIQNIEELTNKHTIQHNDHTEQATNSLSHTHTHTHTHTCKHPPTPT